MKRILSLLALFCTLTAAAQFASPAKFTVKENKISDSEVEIIFTGKVDAGWHVYSVDIPSGGPTAAELTLEKQTGVKPKGKLQARGKVQRHMDDMFGMELSYMEGTAIFAQVFTITAEKYEVAGYLTYGACNDQNCVPPTNVDFSFAGTGKPAAAAAEADKAKADKALTDKEKAAADAKAAEDEAKAAQEQAAAEAAAAATADSLAAAMEQAKADSAAAAAAAAPVTDQGIYAPVADELKSMGETSTSGLSLWTIFLMGLAGGLVALVTPCVWPIIPMTVSFFLKRADNKKKGIRDASIYGISIVVIYVALGLIITLCFGASALNSLSTNAWFNIFFCLLLLVFAASFLGGFEITLPSSWGNAVDSKANKTTGLLSIFLMAFTLSLVSFSCTGPIIGFLLVEVGTSGSSIVAPTVGMLGFAIALALPFTLFAMFPTWLKKAPKSGNWMNCIKVCLGFLELAFALKFLSVADLTNGWGILDREVFLSLWIVIFALLGAYLIGWIRFPHDEDEYDEMGEVVVNHRTGITRFFLALFAFAFAIYMIPGLWGAPCKAVSAFAPPMSTQDFNLQKEEVVEAKFTDYEAGMAYAKQKGLPVMVDFTGFGCVNCRKMEAAVWTDQTVKDIINDDYVLVSLFVDDKTALPEVEEVEENGSTTKLRTIGDKWSYLQRMKFGANAQPFYVLLDNDGKPLNTSYSYDEDIAAFVQWLKKGVETYGEKTKD